VNITAPFDFMLVAAMNSRPHGAFLAALSMHGVSPPAPSGLRLLPAAIMLLIVWVSGIYIFFRPYFVKRARAKRQTN
jgi:hypothetical protein